MSGCSWWDRSTGFVLLTIVLWASLAALTSRIVSIRRFNDAWSNAYGWAPRTLRQQEGCDDMADHSASDNVETATTPPSI